jgi:hypothetical protein
MDSSIRQRLLRIEQELLLSSSHTTGGDEAAALRDTILAVLEDVDEARKQNTLDGETIAIAHSVTSRVAILANGFLDFHIKSSTLTTTLMSDIDRIFSQNDASDFGEFLPFDIINAS